MKILQVQLKKSKDGEPLVSVWKEENNCVGFEHFKLITGFGVYNCNQFLRSLHTGIDIKFMNFKQYNSMLQEINKHLPLTIEGVCLSMEERIRNKIAYLEDMADKYNKLNQKTHNKYLWRENGVNADIEALENVLNDITGEWDEAYKEDLKESECL